MLPLRCVFRSAALRNVDRTRRSIFWGPRPRGFWPVVPRDVFDRMEKEFSQMDKHFGKVFERSPFFTTGRSYEWYSKEVPIVEEDGAKKMKLEIDVSYFKPEDIQVKASKDSLTIEGKRKTDGKVDFEFKKEYDIPEGVQTKEMKCRFTEDSYLVLEAPYTGPPEKAAPKEQDIPIHHE